MPQPLPQMIELEWDGYIGAEDTLVSTWLLGRYPIRVQDFWLPAVEAMGHQLEATGYEDPCDWIGSYMLRTIAGTDWWSWHATGGAVDVDYGGDTDGDGDPTIDKNPHIHRPIEPADPGFGVEWQILEHQVYAVEAIRTVNGKNVWRWLGWSIGDTMHWEPACTPTDIATGIDPGSLLEPCPWDYCDDHYTPEGSAGRGVCNVTEEWQEGVVDWAVTEGIVNTDDNFRDDWERLDMTDGRLWTFLYRYDHR